MAGGRIDGVVGIIKWGFYNAAAINGYTVAREPGKTTWSLRATVVLTDTFKLSQKPLVFVAPHERGAWRWPIEDFNIAEGVLTARLGGLEEF